MKNNNIRLSTLFVAICALSASLTFSSCGGGENQTGSDVEAGLEVGAGIFEFSGHPALQGDTMRVFYHRPSDDISDRPVLFVMHGVQRNADSYRDNWIELSEKHQVLVIVPEFSQELFPKSRSYNYGNLRAEDDSLNPEELWSFSLIDPIFDEAVRLSGSSATGYDLFGHSAGSQFAHRFFVFKPGTKVNRVVAANAGTYTMLDQAVDFPFGLRGMEVDEDRLRTLLGRHLIVQLGEEDNIPNANNLNVTPPALAQGEHRFDRGQKFYQTGRELAEQLGVDFGWTVRTVPGVAHNNAGMAQDIAGHLYPIEE